MPGTASEEVLVPSPTPCLFEQTQEQTEVLEEQKVRDKATVIIFDWDDTLLASSFLSQQGVTLSSENIIYENQLKELETSVMSVLSLALSLGEVFVITNAETGWVELSAQKFIPGVVPLLSQIRVLSARSTYEPMYPDSPLKWKYYAFQERLSGYFLETKTQKNILSFGDSHVEREAVRAVTRGLPNTRTKSVKFAERPSMEQLRRQIQLVTNCFQYIHNHDGDLDLQLTVTATQQQSEGQSEEQQQQQQQQQHYEQQHSMSQQYEQEQDMEVPTDQNTFPHEHEHTFEPSQPYHPDRADMMSDHESVRDTEHSSGSNLASL